MQCLILAGGLGTRVKTITGDKPKALLPIGPMTFIDVQLRWLKLLGLSDIVLCLGHNSEMIVEHLQSFEGHPEFPQMRFSFDGPTLLGTGGALRKASSMVSDHFLVTYGDTLLTLDLHEMIRSHLRDGRGVTLSILQNKNVGDRSNVAFHEGFLRYDKIKITPDMEYIDYGISAVRKDYFLKQTPMGAFDYSTFLTQASEAKQMTPFVVKCPFLEVGSISGYETFCSRLGALDFDLKALLSEQQRHLSPTI